MSSPPSERARGIKYERLDTVDKSHLGVRLGHIRRMESSRTPEDQMSEATEEQIVAIETMLRECFAIDEYTSATVLYIAAFLARRDAEKDAALKAENEALKKELPSEAFKAGCQKNMDDAKALNQELFRKNSTLSAALSRYLDWTPQDPGTKEALAFAGIAFKSGMPGRDEINVLAHALRAAMVRLEEAENKIAAMENRFKGLI